MVEAVSLQPAGHDTHRHCCPALGKFVADTAGGPPAGAAPVLDEAHRLGPGPGVAAKRVAGIALTRQRNDTVGHANGAFSCRKAVSALPILAVAIRLPQDPMTYNVLSITFA